MISNKPLISIIIPARNSKKTIKKCLFSIQKQTFTNIEIIVVVNNSTDSTLRICKKESIRDKRIKVINTDKGGVSNARNIGIDNSCGDFIFFVDSDDWMPSNSLRVLLNHIGDADFCYGEIQLVYPHYDCLFHTFSQSVFDLKNDFDLLKMFDRFDGGPCGKLFKTSIIRKSCLFFNTNVSCMEDSIFISEYLSYCKKAKRVGEVVYFYNKLFENTAMSKYYPNHYEWKLLYVLKRNLLFKKDSEEVNNRLFYFVLTECLNSCKHYAWKAKDDALNKIEKTCNAFDKEFKILEYLPFFSIPIDAEKNISFLCDAIKTKQCESLLNALKKDYVKLNKQKIKEQLFITIKKKIKSFKIYSNRNYFSYFLLYHNNFV